MGKCVECLNCGKLFRRTPWYCTIEKQAEIRNKYTNDLDQRSLTYQFKELNSNGECQYYKPLLSIGIKRKIINIFRVNK